MAFFASLAILPNEVFKLGEHMEPGCKVSSPSTPYNSYLKSLRLANYASELTRSPSNPKNSWKFQRIIRDQLLNAKFSTCEFQLICTKRGYITPDGDWQLPTFKEISTTTTHFPMHQDLAFNSQNLIESAHSIDTPPTHLLLKELFIAAQKANLPWNLPKVCCEGNAYFLYMMYIAMGISPNWMKKIYCFGELDRQSNQTDLHPAISIEDNEKQVWIIDPSIANKPLSVDQWANKIFGTTKTIPRASIFPCTVETDKHYLFEVKGNVLIKFEFNAFEKGYSVKTEPIKSISSFAQSHTMWTLRKPILAQIIKNPSTKEERNHQEAIDKITLFVYNERSLSPLPEDIQAIRSNLIFNTKTISKIMLDDNLNREEQCSLIHQKINSILNNAILINFNLKGCLEKMIKLKFSHAQIALMKTSINKKTLSINNSIEILKEYSKQF
jgi:hypothetical protein